jgi:hypothetical protein
MCRGDNKYEDGTADEHALDAAAGPRRRILLEYSNHHPHFRSLIFKLNCTLYVQYSSKIRPAEPSTLTLSPKP